jgi:16S rRNA (cytosine967-C5)-methyltransferase
MSDKRPRPEEGAAGRTRRGAPGARPARRDDVQQARAIAYDVIRAVGQSDSYANLLLPARLSRAGLSGADAALATELTYGTLRMQGYYDRVIAIAAGRPVDQIEPPILDVLRLGAHQLLSTRVAPHAAVNESVALARRVGSRASSGFSNAVLREIGRRSAEEWRTLVRERALNPDDALAAEYSHPTWVLRAFRKSLAAEDRGDELVALLEADNRAPRVNLVALPGVGERPAGARPDRYSPVGFMLAGGDPARLVADRTGGMRVQDEGSQLAALALTRGREIQPGERWLDMCSGPGGKAALLAAEAARAGATVTANEITPARLELVRKALGDRVSEVELWGRDGRSIGDTDPDAFDRILLDAPCTGLGALRRRPEARWRKTPRDVSELTVLQAELLDSAIRALAPGGLLAYVTCSPHPAETRLQLNDALVRWEGRVSAVNTSEILRSVSVAPIDLAGPEQSVQLWPHRHGTDAMFIALLTKS